VVQGAQLELRDVATNDVRKAETQAQGVHTFPNLSLGKYRLTVSKTGFQTQLFTDVVVEAAKTTDISANLKVGAITETVEVSGGSAPLVETTTNSIGTTIDMKQIEDLPIQSRDIGQLSQLIPGYSGGQTNIGGTWNGLPSIDQGNNIDGIVGSSSRMKFGGNSAPAVTPRLESIEEMTVQTEQLDMNQGFGQASMQINFVTRRGSNAFHGRVFEDFRNAALNANSWNNDALTAIDPSNPQTKNPVKLNDFGGSIGGPIRKNKDFIFGSIEMWRERVPFSVVADVPTMDLRNGQGFSAVPSNIFDPLTSHTCVAKVDVSSCNSIYIRDPFPGNAIPQSRMSPIGKKILSYFPVPKYSGQVNNYIADTGGVYRYDQPIVRWDHVFDDFNRLNVLTSYQWGQEFRNSTGIPGQGASGNIWTRRQPISISANYTHFSHLYIFDVRMSFSRFSQTFPNVDKNGELTAQALGINGITRANSSPFNSPPRVTLDQYSN